MVCDKTWPFLILDEKYYITSYTTCLIRNADTPMSLAMHLIDLLRSLSITAWISRTNTGVFSYQLSSCRTFVITNGLFQLFLNSLLCPQIDTQTLGNLCIGAFPRECLVSRAFCFQIFGGMNCFMVFLSAQKTKAESKRMRKMNNSKWQQFTHRTLYIHKPKQWIKSWIDWAFQL